MSLALSAALALGALAAPPPGGRQGQRAPARVIDHGSRASREIALTFDACSGRPPGRLDEGVLAALAAAKAPATVFAGGRWAEQDPSRVRALLAAGIEVESHAFGHPHLPSLSDAALSRELSRALSSLRALGAKPRFLRAPYVDADARVVRAARALGLRVVRGDVASGDPDPKFSAKILTRWVLSRARGGSIVILHVNGHGVHTAEALPAIIAGLRQEGLEPVTLAALIGSQGGQRTGR